MEKIKELLEIFTKGTKAYTQIAMSANAYLYEVRDSDPNNQQIYFEVFKKIIANASTFPNGNKVPKRVLYPNNEAFGKWAWTISRGNDYSTAQGIATHRFNFLSEKKEVA